MGNLAEKINIGEGRNITMSPEDVAAHKRTEARKSQFQELNKDSDSNVFHMEDLGSEPMPEEIMAEAGRANEILDGTVKIMNNNGLTRDQRIKIINEGLEKVSKGLDILKKHKGNDSPSGNEVRNVFIKKNMLDKFILDK